MNRNEAGCSRAKALLLAGTLLAPAAPAFSQSVAAPTAAAPETASVSEVVVTAQRREQRLQDVGIAITAVNATELAERNVNNATDLTRVVPNLRYNAYSSSQVVFNIRGVSQNDYGDQQEPPVAVYQDDSYSSSITTASFPIFDLARAEVLRGPQGTLFGRNATGGALQFVSNQPTDHPAGYITGTYGSFNQTIVEGAVSGPIAPGLEGRIAGIYDRDDGYIKDITPGQPDRGANDHWALRGILSWKPTEDFKARLILRYTEADHERQSGLYALSPACPNDNFQGAFLPANQVCGYWSGYNGGVPGSMATGYANPSIAPSQGGDAYKTAGTGDPYVSRKFFGAQLRLDGKVAGVDVTSISDYQHLDKLFNEVGDAQPELPYVPGVIQTAGPCPSPAQAVTCYPPGVVFFQRAKVEQYSEELRASKTLGSHYLVAGAFGMIIDGDYGAKFATPFDGYDPTVAYTQRTESFAFFAQDEWKLTDKVKLIGGLRYWHDAKRADYSGSELFSGFTLNFGLRGVGYNDPTGTTPLTGLTVQPSAATPSYDGLTARAEIDYKPVSNVLLYASYNRGSKSGGFTFSTGTPTLGQAVIDTLNGIPYRPETLDAYELGMKATLAPGTTLNLSAYHYDYSNYQAFVQVGFTEAIRNLPARADGIEADLRTSPIQGLTLGLSGGFEDSSVKDILLPDGVTVVKHDLPQAPDFSGSAFARYEFPLFRGTASVQGDVLYQGSTCFTVLCAPVEREGAYDVENIRIGFAPGGGRLEFAFFINNLLENTYRVYAYDSSLYNGNSGGIFAKPRTFGLTATYRY